MVRSGAGDGTNMALGSSRKQGTYVPCFLIPKMRQAGRQNGPGGPLWHLGQSDFRESLDNGRGCKE
eukprot:8661546-Karenia_brevis.AAC.1